MTLCWQDSYTSKMTYKRSKLGQTDLVFLVCDQSSSVCLCKSLSEAVMICRAGLSIVPVVPLLDVRTFSVGLNVTTTTKKRSSTSLGKKCTARENHGYAYEKRAPALRWYGPPRMVNRALMICATLVNRQTHRQIALDRLYY